MLEAQAATTVAATSAAAAADELAGVDGLVERLASAFEVGLDFYNTWLQRQQAQNTYHRTTSHRSPARARPIKCAVSTSLDMSSYRIQSTYQIAFTLIGPDFAAGDDQTRQTLTANLSLLQDKIRQLCHTITCCLHQQQQQQQPQQPLPLREVYLCSEQVRLKSVSALAMQYRRMAAGRQPSLPRTLPAPRPKRMSTLLDDLDEADLRFTAERPVSSSPSTFTVADCVKIGGGGGIMERIVTAESEIPLVAMRSNPPSPPLTPKARAGGFWRQV
ncbi:hypothetical protein QBC36DRAFT_289185 [Triangularia setosa]|uniref:Uncharacterized protein n=1 Tax=Triangularia setosa TaxID=2587417 RepID=A0AAN6W9A8_9PEZI|nr:hypothetical protein QBC36DRAFT_289185 [Podospora setosa]